MSEFMTITQGLGYHGETIPTLGVPVPKPPILQPSGFALPSSNLPDFTLAYIEDFNRPVEEGPLTTDGTSSPFDGVYGTQAHNDLAGGVPTVIGAYPSTFLDSSKHGRYGTAICSVAEGSSILQERIRFEAGWPRVCALVPRLGNCVPGIPYGPNDFLGGATEIAWRISIMPTYKVVPLYWPKSNHSRTVDGVGADGENDFPEFNTTSTAKVGGFLHEQGTLSGTVVQTGFSSPTVVGAGTGWHKTRSEWYPAIPYAGNPIHSVGGACRYWLDDLLLKFLPGSVDGVARPWVPMNPMHLVIQQETALSGTVDTTVIGLFEIDWIAFYTWNGTGP